MADPTPTFTRTANARFIKPKMNSKGWAGGLNNTLDMLDGMSALGSLAVTVADPLTVGDSTVGLAYRIAPGNYRKSTGEFASFAGNNRIVCPASTTTFVWLNDDGTPGAGSAFPTTGHVRLASVTTDATSVVGRKDLRYPLDAATGLPRTPLSTIYVAKAGDTITGDLIIGGSLTTGGMATLASAKVNGATTLAGSLSVAGASTMAGVSAASVSVSGATNLATLTASGPAGFASTTTTGNASIGGTLTVTGATSLAALMAGASTLGATTTTSLMTSGLATLASTSVTGNAAVGGTMVVSGSTTLATLTASSTTLGATSATTLSTSALASLASLAVAGQSTLGGTVTVNGASAFNAATVHASTLSVKSGATGTLYVDPVAATLGTFGVTPAVQQPAIPSLTDTTGGIVSGTLAAIPSVVTPASINNALASIRSNQDKILAVLRIFGFIKP